MRQTFLRNQFNTDDALQKVRVNFSQWTKYFFSNTNQSTNDPLTDSGKCVAALIPDILAFRLCEVGVEAVAQVPLHKCVQHLPKGSKNNWPSYDKSVEYLCSSYTMLVIVDNVNLTPCPKALVKAFSALVWSVLKNWWTKSWAMKANIRLVPWGSGRNLFLLKKRWVISLGSGRTALPVHTHSHIWCRFLQKSFKSFKTL